MSRTYILNYIAKKINAKTYLEIGVADGHNFENIKVKNKVGVDPNIDRENVIKCTSNEFFKSNTDTFDLVFIDGLHYADQVLMDIENSLSVLNPGGYIICHDMLPYNKNLQEVPWRPGPWTGDCWKAFYHLRQTREDLYMFTIDVDMGCGIITKGIQELLPHEEMTYENFEVNRHDWMNIKSLDEFYTEMNDEDVYNSLLNHYINAPYDGEVNFYLGRYYHNLKQTASAISFYLRAAERTDDILLKYECLLRASMCFESQGCRNNSVLGMLQHAVAILPDRPEAYYMLGTFYERQEKWFDAYLMACLGERVFDLPRRVLRTEIDYPGYYGILFNKAVSSWWCGLCEESRDLFKYIILHYPLNQQFKEKCINNLQRLNAWKKDSDFISELKTIEEERQTSEKIHKLYIKGKTKLKNSFSKYKNIKRNYSEAFQDIFILTLLDGQENGYYVEIGSGYPLNGNNTYLLEEVYDWTGISIDITPEAIERHFRDRKHRVKLADATTLNYTHLFNQIHAPKIIDYLQIDCDPASVSYQVLTQIPFDKFKFKILTFEHDLYVSNENRIYRDESRKFLQEKGYTLLIPDVSIENEKPYEDWWVNVDVITPAILMEFKRKFQINSQENIPFNLFIK